MTSENDEKAALFGPSGRGEYQEGEVIRFRDAASGEILRGKIGYVRAPGPAIQGGKRHPLTYIVDAGDGIPHAVYSGDIIA